MYELVDAAMLDFIDAVIAFAPLVLAPLRRQLAAPRTCSADNGWIHVIDVADGAPIAWAP